MIQIDHIQVFGFGHVLRNMRNPKESWARSDSAGVDPTAPKCLWLGIIETPDFPYIGPKDLELLTNLVAGGSEHRKVIRTLQIWIDIVPWRGMWQEVDTYKIATVRNSCSTMHKLGYRDLVPADFQDEDVDLEYLARLNVLAAEYRASGHKDKALLMKIKHRLPEGFLQRAGLQFNYETALTMFSQRRSHAVPEWRWSGAGKPDLPDTALTDDMRAGRWPSVCDMLWRLPLFKELVLAKYRGAPTEK